MTTTDLILLNNWHAVALVEDCQPGKIVKARLLGEDLVIWRPEEPHSPIQVWQDYCPHRGARLSWLLYAYNPSLVKQGHLLNSDIIDKVLRQDIPVLESQRPKRLPLLTRGKADTKWPEELHVPCDRASVAYRRWLKQLGVTYGVC